MAQEQSKRIKIGNKSNSLLLLSELQESSRRGAGWEKKIKRQVW
jgi:hypothetical protein